MTRKSTRRPLTTWWAELQENFSIELLGLLIFLAGGFGLLSLLPSNDPFRQTLPWLTGMIGWTAPLFAGGLLILGAVLMLGERAGFWSVEAIVGAELWLLSMQAGTFVWYNLVPNWAPQTDGANGGLIGVGVGSVLLAALGRWPALAVLALLNLLGLWWLLRFTPLCLLFGQERPTWHPGRLPLGALVQRWSALVRPVSTPAARVPGEPPTGEALAGNFVSAHEPTPRRAAVRRQRTAQPGPGEPVEATPPASVTTPPPTRSKPKTRSKKAEAMQSVASDGTLPSLDLLIPEAALDSPVDVRAMQQLIEDTLSDFNVPVRTIHVETGPTVTQFGVEPLYLERAGQRRKVRVSRIVNLADDLALALAVPAVRIEAPVPGRPYVGIEVPNPDKKTVTLRGILESKALAQDGGKLALPLGRNTAGAPMAMDLTRAPHMLIAGATGAGKSVCINTIITGLLMQHGPEQLRFVMVDPKMVELPGYNGIPHLIGQVITEVDQVMGALTWLLLQMDDRYRLFQQAGVRNLEAYNALVSKGKEQTEGRQPLPYIVLIIDELADLMMTAAEDIERQICRLAQMARATGIHLILATQRPSVDVVTGLIKANFPTRIAFAVTSQTDSRVILDTPGAERLLGRGDMLVMRPDVAKLWRVQGCFVADDEIGRVASFWKNQATSPAPTTPAPWLALLDRLEDEDELLQDAIDAVRDLEQVTTSQLQRKLRVGYPKAARLMDQLEAKGIVGPDQGSGQGRAVRKAAQSDEQADDEHGDDLFESSVDKIMPSSPSAPGEVNQWEAGPVGNPTRQPRPARTRRGSASRGR